MGKEAAGVLARIAGLEAENAALKERLEALGQAAKDIQKRIYDRQGLQTAPSSGVFVWIPHVEASILAAALGN